MNTPAVTTPTADRKSAGLPLDPRTYDRALSCVHCGLCLPACPTYVQTGQEADSPRGRIQLIRGLADGVIEPTESVRRHLDLCLDCRGCETACPSGVVYHELIEETRALLAPSQSVPLQGRLMRWLFFHIFVYPTRLKLALLPARVLQKLGIYRLLRKSGLFGVLPTQLRKMEQMLPAEGPLWPKKFASPVGWARPTTETQRGGPSPPYVAKPRIGFFTGCIGSVMFEKVNRQAAELLAAAGAEVLPVSSQICCGALHQHSGFPRPAMEFARRNIDAFVPKDGPAVDLITTTISGCGAMLHEYDHLLRDDPEYADRARIFASKVRDISQVLLELGVSRLLKYPVNETVTYHDACHLAHAQRVTAPPRQLLAAIPSLKLVPLPESDLCCGAAGTYNLTEPEMSASLAQRKVRNVASTGAAICVTGNVGCAMQIQSQADSDGVAVRAVHPVELLHRACFGNRADLPAN